MYKKYYLFYIGKNVIYLQFSYSNSVYEAKLNQFESMYWYGSLLTQLPYFTVRISRDNKSLLYLYTEGTSKRGHMNNSLFFFDSRKQSIKRKLLDFKGRIMRCQ